MDTRTFARIYSIIIYTCDRTAHVALRYISLFFNGISSYFDAVVEHRIWHAPIPIHPICKRTHTHNPYASTTVPSCLRVKCTVEHGKISVHCSRRELFFSFFLLAFQCALLWLIYAPFICTLRHQIFGKDVWPINFERQSISQCKGEARQNDERLATITSQHCTKKISAFIVTIDTN